MRAFGLSSLDAVLLLSLYAGCRYVQVHVLGLDDPTGIVLGNAVLLTTEEDQPLVQLRHDYFDQATASVLRRCALNHPRVRSGVLYQGNFRGTRGFVCKFNAGGEKILREDDDMRCLLPLLDRVRDPLANAFVVNVGL